MLLFFLKQESKGHLSYLREKTHSAAKLCLKEVYLDVVYVHALVGMGSMTWKPCTIGMHLTPLHTHTWHRAR